MPRLFDDSIEKLDDSFKQQSDENLINQLKDLNPVDSVILPDGKPAIIRDDNKIIPIGGQESFGTINQDGNLILTVISNQPNSVISINDEKTFKTTPTKLSFTIGDVLKSGNKIITAEKEG
jgi:hypothetical protein